MNGVYIGSINQAKQEMLPGRDVQMVRSSGSYGGNLMPQTNMTRVIVLGGGYAGIVSALRLSRKMRHTNVHITLVNGTDYFIERIRLHQQAAGQELVRYDYATLLAGTPVRFLHGWITQLDPQAQQVEVKTAVGSVQLPYDYAIYALGSIVDTTSVPGVSEHAFSLSTAETTQMLRNVVPDVAARGGTALVCGGGLTGVEAATELAETYPGLQVTLVTADRFGAQLSQKGRQYLQQAFDRLGIAVMDGQRVTAVHPHHIQTANETAVPFDVCLWAGSFRAPDLARAAGLPVNNRGQIIVDQHLRAQGYANLYAIGDAASLEEAMETPIRMGCATAAPMGSYVGNHLAAVIQGNNAGKPYRFRYVMRCISLGREDGLVQFVEADDTPKERILTGRMGAKVKEFVSRSSVWNLQMEQKFASLMTRNQSNKKGVNNHVSDNQLTYRHSRSA
jgi:NADH dehydrogenase FAD-containing subunit